MKFISNKSHFLTNLVIVVLGIITYFILDNFNDFQVFILKILNILSPFIFGGCIAFLMYSPMKFIENKILIKFNFSSKLKRTISITCSLLFLLFFIVLFFWILVPQLIASVIELKNLIPDYFHTAYQYLLYLLEELNIDQNYIANFINVDNLIKNATNYLGNIVPALISSGLSAIKVLFNLVIGIIVAVYILSSKEFFKKQFKLAMYAYFKEDYVEKTLSVMRLTNVTFNRFIFGKIIDSIIIGLLCMFFTSLFGFEYAILISTIVGITNVIPFFGPFIGAIPGIFILLIANPIQAIQFSLFIFALQQFDGNILGPKILGDTIGLPSFWILFSIIVGGGLFGIVGMFVGVPIFSVIYSIVNANIQYRLSKIDNDYIKNNI